MRSIAIAGASLAGLRAAETLRAEGFDGDLTIVGSEPHLPYDRPPLSKDFLLGTVEAPDLALSDEELRGAIGARWLLGRTATGLGAGSLTLDGGETIPADGVVIATGTRARRLPAGADLDGVQELRTLDDASALKKSFESKPRVVIIGAGFIGTEVASTAVSLGLDVTVVDTLERPFAGQLGPTAAKLLRRTLAENGVRLCAGVGVAAVTGGPRVEQVRLTDGSRLDAGLVLVGIGAVPNTEWLAGSAVACENGVLTDAWGRTTVPGVVAAGDVACLDRPGGRQRIEHWTHARDMPVVAVKALLAHAAGGDPGPSHTDPPYFWSEQFGRRVQLVGRIKPEAPVDIVEGAIEDGRFVGVQRHHGAVTAILGWSMPREFTRWRRRARRDDPS